MTLYTRDYTGTYSSANNEAIINAAHQLLYARLVEQKFIGSPLEAAEFLRYKLGALDHECFGMMWLDSKNRLLDFEIMFRGTIDQTIVHVREVAKSALKANASRCIAVHNHPSGDSSPSNADIALTQTLIAALKLFEVKVLDHVIVGANFCTSMAEHNASRNIFTD